MLHALDRIARDERRNERKMSFPPRKQARKTRRNVSCPPRSLVISRRERSARKRSCELRSKRRVSFVPNPFFFLMTRITKKKGIRSRPPIPTLEKKNEGTSLTVSDGTKWFLYLVRIEKLSILHEGWSQRCNGTDRFQLVWDLGIEHETNVGCYTTRMEWEQSFSPGFLPWILSLRRHRTKTLPCHEEPSVLNLLLDYGPHKTRTVRVRSLTMHRRGYLEQHPLDLRWEDPSSEPDPFFPSSIYLQRSSFCHSFLNPSHATRSDTSWIDPKEGIKRVLDTMSSSILDPNQ